MDNNVLSLVLPVFLVVLANTMYNICTKSTPGDVNPFATLIVTYVVAAIVTTILFFVFARPENAIFELSKINWTSIVLGIAIVGLETGYILMYRAGWKVGNASVVANICLACTLLIVGFILYNENISLKQILGIAVCIVGLVLVTK
ncbi:EamA family transporter [uncultured Methanobrevibacter sp.]|uniref:EamA family transporter n=1 Tax=uncultured Methanobrevibacter sp. TaxID=253161 RepID=UPI0025E718A5|nr:EamA family transporter [uncultured Methanobrevibacter sp.]